MHEKDPIHHEYVKAYYMHLLLDHLKETRFNDFEKAIEEFLSGKVLSEISLPGGVVISFKSVLDDVISFFRTNEHEILKDIHGN